MQKHSNKLVALGTLAVITASTLGTMTTPAHAGWIRHHRGATAALAVGGYLAYRHYHKKHQQRHYYQSTNRYRRTY